VIVEALGNLVFGVLGFVLDVVTLLLPDWTPFDLSGVGDTIATHSAGLFGWIAWANLYTPLVMLLGLAALRLTVWIAALVWRAVNWLIWLIPWIG
jgi:hypothetical protein